MPQVPEAIASSWLEENRPDFFQSDAVRDLRDTEEIGYYYLKSVYWTERIFDAIRPLRSGIKRLLPGLVGTAVGYLDPVADYEEDAFGIILFCRP